MGDVGKGHLVHGQHVTVGVGSLAGSEFGDDVRCADGSKQRQ